VASVCKIPELDFVDFVMETTLSEIQNSLTNDATRYERKVYNVVLKENASLYKIGHNIKEFKCRFFIGNNGMFCYQPLTMKRRGFMVNFDHNIEKIIVVEKKQYDVLENAKVLLKKIHPNAWDELRATLKEAIDKNDASLLEHEYMLQGRVKYRYILSDIKKHSRWNVQQVMEGLKQAFENKTPYSWSHRTSGHSGRDISISIEMKEDGVLRAWLSSEFMGCGNGDYYLLINPTTAIFSERD
jgi:hypothetical protein